MAKYTSTSSNEKFTGNLGNDIVVFNGSLITSTTNTLTNAVTVNQNYIIDASHDTSGVHTLTIANTVSGGDGVDVLSGIEKIIFKDTQLTLSQESIVNIATVGNQTEAAMLTRNDGGFYSFWQSEGDATITDPKADNGAGYFFRTFDSNGSAGQEVRLLTGAGTGVSQAVFSDNSFVLVWTDDDASDTGVFAQIYNSDGSVKIPKYRVNDTIKDVQGDPCVAVLQSGGFVVSWTSANQGDAIHSGNSMGEDPNAAGVFTQMFDANGNPLGWEQKVGDSGGGNSYVSAINAGSNAGGYVVTYEGKVDDGGVNDGTYVIKSSIYDKNSNIYDVSVDDFQVNTITEGTLSPNQNELRGESKDPSSIVLASGNIVYVWQAPLDAYLTPSGDLNYDRSIAFSMIDTNGNQIKLAETNTYYGSTTYFGKDVNNNNALITEAQFETLYPGFQANPNSPNVNTFWQYDQSQPAAAALTGGGFVIVWQSMLQDQSYWGVYGQRFDSAGNKVGGEFLVNTKTADSQDQAAVTALTDGGFVVSWHADYQDGNQQGLFQEGTGGSEIVMQRYDATGKKLGQSFAGTAGNDDITLSGNDSVELDGAAGNDILITSLSTDTAHGGGNDTIRGGLGDDSISSGSGKDILIGGDGSDTINGGAGNDTIYGGDGSDIFVLSGNLSDYTKVGGNGTYIITDTRTGSTNDGVDVVSGIEVLRFADQDISIDSNTSGGTTGVLVTGDPTIAENLMGGDNNDTLQGGGNIKGVGLDTMQGGNGDDTYIVLGNAAVIYDTKGNDTLQIGTSIDLNQNRIGKLDGLQYVDNVTLLGSKSYKIIGNADDNVLTGNNGSNKIDGGDGADTINGGLGKDSLIGGLGDDVFIFDSALSKSNVDKIVDYVSGSDSILLADAFFSNLDDDGDGVINFTSGSGITSSSNDLVSFVVYDTKTGSLYYDAAGHSSVQFAQLAKVSGILPTLDASDFSII